MRHGAVWAGLAREACGTLQIAWARWRGDDVLLVLGHRMRLVGRLQRAARVPRAAAAPEVDAWLTRTFRPLFGEITERCPASYPPYPVGD